MKKNYLSLFAAATMLLATTSCSDESQSVPSQNNAMTTFKVELQGVAGSRTAGDGQTVNKLYYAVYDKAGTKVIYPSNAKYGVETISEGKAKVDLPLMKSEEYDIVFWAQYDDAASYSFTELTNITVNYAGLKSNNENRDAFFNALDDFEANGETQEIKLYRPFGQLNVATAIADWNEALRQYQANGNEGNPVKYSSVTIDHLATTFNAKTGAATGETTAEVVFDKNDVLDESIWIKGEDAEGNEAELEYKLLAMNYVLMTANQGPAGVGEHVAAPEEGNKDNVDLTFALWKDADNQIVKASVPAVPIQRNYRTNILGSFLTGDATQFNIVVDADFDGDKNVESGIIFEEDKKIARIYSVDGLKLLGEYVNGKKSRAESGESFDEWTVYLENDIDLNYEEWTPIGESSKNFFAGTFDGKGKTVSNFKVTTKEGYAGLFGYARATFKNLTVNGVVVTANHYAGGIVGQGYCNFDDCHAKNVDITLTVKNGDWSDKAGGIIGQNCEGNLYIKNCTAEKVTIKGYRDLGGIAGMVGEKNTVSGCSVKNVTIEQDLTNAYKEETQTTLAGVVGRKGANVTCEDNTVGENVYIASTADEVLAAMLTSDAENISVKLLKDTEIAISDLGSQTAGSGEYKLGGENTKNITIDLNNYKLTITTTYWSSLGAKNADALFTIKNGTMTSSQESGTWNSYDLTFANCNYAINNVTFDKAIAFTNTGKEATLANVAINETHDYYAMWVSAEGQTLNIDGLTIDSSGRGIKIDEQYVDAPAKVTMNIKNSTFKTANKAAILVKSVAGAEINADNLNIADVAADDFNAVWVDEDAAAYADLVKVAGTGVIVEGTPFAAVATADELKNALASAEQGSVIALKDGIYEGHFDLTTKNVTLQAVGKNAKIKGMLWADNCNVTVKGLTLTNPDGVTHPNTQNSSYFTTINNQYPLVGAYNNADIKFEDCTFDIVGPTVYGFYGYAHNKPVFEGCTFNCNKIRPIASNGPALTINDCTFNDPYHYAARIFENSSETQTIVFTNNTIQGSNDKGEFEGINISKKGSTATVLGNFTIKGNTDVKYRHHEKVTMSANCTYDTDIENFAFEKEQ